MNSVITPLTPQQEATAEQQTADESYLKKDLVAVDIATNVVLGGNEDETISSRMARWDTQDTGIKHEVGEIVSEGLDLIQPDHGALAEAGDLERAKQVKK